jgi:hypothetical protein
MLKKKNKRLPNALIIGVQKSATTWLTKRLAQHHEVFVANDELHYFDNNKNYSHGADWYRSQFDGVGSQKILCEKTGAYSWTECDGVDNEPQDKQRRIKALVPNAKLIMILRDPVERAISAWNHNLRSGAISLELDINKILTDEYAPIVRDHGILSRGLYYKQLLKFRECFPIERLLILFHETDIKEQPDEAMRKVCKFLGVSEEYKFDDMNRPENQVEKTRIGVQFGSMLGDRYRRVWDNIDRRILTKLPIGKVCYMQPSSKVYKELRQYYEQEISDLESILGSLPEAWRRV